MRTVTIAVDLAKNVFELALASASGVIHDRKRLSRAQFEKFWGRQAACRVVMEACGSAHFWARFLIARGFDVVLLPPHYVKPYRRRNKTDRADCEALLEAARNPRIHPVAVKSEDQQALLALHRVRSQWLDSRTARLNQMRALLREYGLVFPAGARKFMNEFHAFLEPRRERLPGRVRGILHALWDEVRDLERRIEAIEEELEQIALNEPVVQRLLRIPGIGILTATALFATVGKAESFTSGRKLACWLGLTPREFSSGSRRRLGRISKQGDEYVRTLLIHGARSALNAARRLANADKPLSQLQAWALERTRTSHSNKAAVALANKLARIGWAVWRHERAFEGDYVIRVAA